jgi:hypothetical protein
MLLDIPLIKKKYLLLFAYSFCSQFAPGQNKNFTVREIDSIVNRIDSGGIRYGVAAVLVKEKRRQVKALAADWFYTDISGAKLLKAVKQTSIEADSKDIYYFYNDSLIYLKVSNGTYFENKKEVNWQGQYYFQNSTLIFKQDDLKFTFNPAKYLETARQFFSPEQVWRRLN